jgi:amino acid adenylation domain-containing protein
MKNINAFISDLYDLNIKLRLDLDNALLCHAPKDTLTPELLQQLKERKQEIIVFLKQSNTAIRSNLPSILPTSRDQNLLSFAQNRLWFLDQMEPDSFTYNIPVCYHLTGILNIAALEQSFNEIIHRHEVLRTTFPTANGQPFQFISPPKAFTLSTTDLQEHPETEREEIIQQIANEEAQHTFDLAQESLLFRARLLRLEESEYVLLLNMHHIIFDGWSFSVFFRELAVLYEAFSANKPSPLPILSIQYADFAYWQRNWLQGEVLESQLSYWRQQLSGNLPILQLPTDYPRPSVATHSGAYQSLELSKELTQALKTLGQQEGATMFMILIAAFQTLLCRYSGQEDIIIGTPVAGRNQIATEGLIGLFVNTLVIRTDLSSNPSFRQLVRQVREVTLGAYEHQDLPLEKLIEELNPDRDLSRSPLFQVMFAFQNTPQQIWQPPSLTVTRMEIHGVTSKFDLTLNLRETPQGLIGGIEYNTDLFKADTITRMLGHFQVLLEGIVASPDQPLSDLPLLTLAEQHQLLVEWNDTATEYPHDKCIHQLFEEQVEKTPDAVAVVFEEQELTYQQLNHRANQLAHHLQSLGVKPEVLVGICVERSLEMVIGLLAILKAGGAYVPLDPSYPQERLSYMLEDANVLILLTTEKLASELPYHLARVFFLDTEWKNVSSRSKENPLNEVKSSNLAYVIYTSGSTGNPKGVLVCHYNVVRLFAATQLWFHFDEKDVWTLFHSYSFDFSVWELWGALLNGGRLVVVSYWVSREPQAFYKLLQREGVTVLNQTPSAFRQLIRAEELSEFVEDISLRLIIFGGEMLDLQSLKPWFERHGDKSPQLVNMYGITETTVHVSYLPLTVSDINNANSMIGRPISDLQIYVLDRHQKIVPVGVPGELHIGGDGLARGYLNLPEMTDRRFINSPFSNKAGRLIYKSGDLGRYLSNGNIEYLGRIDNQVKIRGFRIELGEIQTVISQYQFVKENVVTMRADNHGEKHLVAYIVHDNKPFIASELHLFLKQKLPDYMIPVTFVLLESLPLTSNGKVDYDNLPVPDQSRPNLESVFVAPRTLEEELLAGIWTEVIGIDRVGIYDNFFDLGGDSIRSIQIIAKARQVGLTFSLQQLFQYQTIYKLARLVSRELTSLSVPKTQAFSLISDEERSKLPVDIEDAYPITALQAGMLFHSDYSFESCLYQNINSYHLRVPFDEQKLQNTIQELASRHPVIRTSFNLNENNELLQMVHRKIHIPLKIYDLCHLSFAQQEEALNDWFEEEKKQHFDWTYAPLLRFHVHRRSENTFQLSLTEHHAILDGWSVAVMFSELFKHYLFAIDKKSCPMISRNESTFRDYVALEQLTLKSKECQDYWIQKLNNTNITSIPRWNEYCNSSTGNNELQKENIGTQIILIHSEVSDGLKRLAKDARVPLKSVLLAAHMMVLRKLTNQADVLTGLISNGRLEEVDGEQVLGLFLNTLPFYLKLLGGNWTDLARETFKAEQEAIPFRRYPLAELQKIFNGQPLFETAFNFTHFHIYQDILELKDLEILDKKFFGQTNFTLVANFNLDNLSSHLKVTLDYDSNKLCEDQVRTISTYYAKTLAEMANQPCEQYESYSFLSESECHQQLVEWNNTQRDYPKNTCIHQLFEVQVEKTPDAVAAVFEDRQLTYQQLNHRANQLAHHLQSLGVKPEVLVGICVERSLEMVIGLLAILKAGGAYVPLDPSYPQERLSYMLRDSAVGVLLTQHSLGSQIPSHSAHVFCLDTDWESIEQHSQENLDVVIGSDHLAYVIYTSGSTGNPKGTMNTQRGVFNRLLWMQEVYQLNATDSVLQKTPFSFDVSVWEFFWPLLAGARLVIAKPGGHKDSDYLINLITQEQITTAHFVPSMLRVFLESYGVEKCKSLRRVICSGETLILDLHNKFFQLLDCELHNLYGPTEAAIDVTFWQCKKNSSLTSIPIGRPIANTQIYILNEHLQPVPLGTFGEIYIGGDGLSRGYLNRPELTQEKFIPNPFDLTPGSRLYKTGDLACYLPDGNIEFIGRIDNQVKIRGFRIELGEIETVLSQNSHIRQCVVTASGDIENEKRLIAYVIYNSAQTPTVDELRCFLKHKLPDYMVPGVFIFLETFPLTPNGKIDRRALPTPDQSRPNQSNTFISPCTAVEQQLADIWTSILKIEQVGIYDNFFTLGGHSLQVIQVISRLRQTFKIDLALNILFELPSIAELGAYIENILWSADLASSINTTENYEEGKI